MFQQNRTIQLHHQPPTDKSNIYIYTYLYIYIYTYIYMAILHVLYILYLLLQHYFHKSLIVTTISGMVCCSGIRRAEKPFVQWKRLILYVREQFIMSLHLLCSTILHMWLLLRESNSAVESQRHLICHLWTITRFATAFSVLIYLYIYK